MKGEGENNYRETGFVDSNSVFGAGRIGESAWKTGKLSGVDTCRVCMSETNSSCVYLVNALMREKKGMEVS